MTDLELLTAAAKEAGINAEVHSELGLGPEGLWLKGARSTDNSRYWNPLNNDGDALRLVVKLEIRLCFGANYVIADGVQQPTVNNANDPYAAVRYAIVRAAAELSTSAVGAA